MVSYHAAAPVPRIDLWLAAAIATESTIHRLLGRMGVEQHAIAAVRNEAEAAGITERSLTTPARIVEFFGAPAITRADRLVYDSVLWPAHQFVWAISRWGDAGPLGFRLREPLAVAPVRVDRDPAQVRAHLQTWHHTEHEVRCALGRPDRAIGYPHSSRWLYLTAARRVCMQFAFSWGLLRDISTRPVAAPLNLLATGGPRCSST
jgi:hypothetical protein